MIKTILFIIFVFPFLVIKEEFLDPWKKEREKLKKQAECEHDFPPAEGVWEDFAVVWFPKRQCKKCGYWEKD